MSAPAGGAEGVTLAPIAGGDAPAVGRFLHEQLNPRVPASSWEALVRPPWAAESPNHGFQLLDARGRIVGAYVAVYSAREDGALPVCNLAAFCVLPEHRMHSLRLVRALLKQRGYLFTDLSPSGNVPAMNDRLGFTRLDTATRLVANLPGRVRGATATEEPSQLAGVLSGEDLRVYEDHVDAPAARHLLVRHGAGHADLVYRRDRRKRMPLFASPLHVGGDPLVLERAWPVVSAHLLRQRLPATLAERRVLGFTPPGPGRELSAPRVKMYKGTLPPGREVDYLYSEMTLLRW